MSLTLTFQVNVKSDYHVGAGYGKGTEIDSALLRDAQGRPVLRGTVLNGLLRDGLWRLLQQKPLQGLRRCQGSGLTEDATDERYCGQYQDGNFVSCPICRLFGTPRVMKRWRVGSACPITRDELDKTPLDPAQATSHRVTRVRVNPRTRRAAPRKLFSEEQGGQLLFEFAVTCPADDEMALDEAALLVAAARFVRQLGRSRRRGQGECVFSLEEVTGVDLGSDPQAALLERFESHWLKDAPAMRSQPERESLARGRERANEGKPVRLRLLARADEPLIIARRASAGNQFRTQMAIPGKTLRGALASRAAECFDLTDEVTYHAFVDLFLRGSVDFPVLYPLRQVARGNEGNGANFYAAVPVPRDGFACKVYPQHPVQWGTQSGERIEECAECSNPVKGVREAFLSLQEKLERFEPERRSEMHIRIDPETGRVEEGQLFEYAALESGQFFAGEIVCADEEAWDLLQTLADLKAGEPVSLRLGKATRRGYGKVTLWLEPMDGNSAYMWVQKPVAERVKEGREELTLTFLTDAVISDPWGRFVTGFKSEWLTQELSFPVRVIEGRAFAATRLVDGFNTKVRLPRWRDIALAAGSTVRLRLLDLYTSELQDRLQEIERKGIGLRRNEGYGRVVFGHPLYDSDSGLSDVPIEIPAGLAEEARLEGARDKTQEFRESWKKALDKQTWSQCQDARFLGLARWLDARQHDAVEELLSTLETAGEPDELLIECVGGREERGDREIANPLTDEAGLKLVKRMLQRLRDEDAPAQQLGIRMVADRLAEAAGKKGEER
jgi:CRISPR-associated protein Csx10